MTLKPSEVERFYDEFGAKQDTQGFYEDPAIDDLVAHASISEAEAVFEFGCGTGRLAARLLSEELSSEASYVACDLSRTMVLLARERLAAFGERVQVTQSDGAVRFPVSDHSVDRVISTYVLDLLSEEDIGRFFLESSRKLRSGGKVCLVSLTAGPTALSRVVSATWSLIFRLRASWVGGCRPICLAQHVDRTPWELEHRNVVVSFGVPSEVIIARVRA